MCGRIAISGCRSFSIAITFFELAVVENPRMQLLETNTFVVLLLKLVGFFYPQAQLMCVKNRSAMRGLSMFSCFYCTCLSIRHKDRQQNAMDIRQNTVQSRQTKRHKVLSRVYTRATCCRQQNCCQFVASLLLGTKGYMLPRYNQHVACRTTLPWCKRGFT